MPDGSVFEACSLTLLAEHLRDKRWVDLRIDAPTPRDRLVPRVRIVEIRVLAEREDIIVRQEWLEKDEFYHEVHKFDGDAIWRAIPSNYHIEQVEPYGRTVVSEKGPLRPMSETIKGRLFEMICADLAKQSGRTFDTVAKADANYEGCGERHMALILLYELTDDSATALCKRFGYRSQMPLHSARGNLRDPAWRGRIVPMEKQLRRVFPNAHVRRTSYLYDKNLPAVPATP